VEYLQIVSNRLFECFIVREILVLENTTYTVKFFCRSLDVCVKYVSSILNLFRDSVYSSYVFKYIFEVVLLVISLLVISSCNLTSEFIISCQSNSSIGTGSPWFS